MIDDREMIDEIVQMTAEGCLGSIQVTPRPVPEDNQAEIRAHVGLIGDWHGLVALSCSARFARGAASEMFGVPPEVLRDEQMVDAIGELVNIVGGNIKAMLNKSCVLSLPEVVVGVDSPPLQGKCVSRAAYSSEIDDEPVVVSLLRGNDE